MFRVVVERVVLKLPIKPSSFGLRPSSPTHFFRHFAPFFQPRNLGVGAIKHRVTANQYTKGSTGIAKFMLGCTLIGCGEEMQIRSGCSLTSLILLYDESLWVNFEEVKESISEYFTPGKVYEAFSNLFHAWSEHGNNVAGYHFLRLVKHELQLEITVPPFTPGQSYDTRAIFVSECNKLFLSDLPLEKKIALNQLLLYCQKPLAYGILPSPPFYKKTFEKTRTTAFYYILNSFQTIPMRKWPEKKSLLLNLLCFTPSNSKIEIGKALASSKDHETREIGKLLLQSLQDIASSPGCHCENHKATLAQNMTTITALKRHLPSLTKNHLIFPPMASGRFSGR